MKGGVSILLLLVLLAGAQAGEVWKGTEKLTDEQAVALFAAALGSESKGQPLNGVVFRGFHDAEFYDWVRKAQQTFGASLTDGNRTNFEVKVNFEGASFYDVEFLWFAMPGCLFKKARFEDATFRKCNLSHAHFEQAEFSRTWFLECDLKNASFNGEDQSDPRKKHADRRSKKYSIVSFNDSDLSECDFRFSAMESVEFLRCALSKSEVAWAKFNSTRYDPLPKSAPFLASFGSFEGLPEFSYQESPTGMTELRNAFKEAGLRREERQITAALCRQQMREGGRWEGKFKRLLFDLPSAFGMSPGRPLRILLGLCVFFALPYAWAILRRPSTSGAGGGRIWQVPLEGGVSSSHSEPRQLHVNIKESGPVWGVIRALFLGMFFSLISAFGVGYRDLDVGRWIERINPDESTLRATGWLRTVSGVQGLISFYLLVLWLLTYFGRPFE
jgi:hypothetical protein